MVTSRYPFGAPNCHTINGNNSVQPILYNGYDHPPRYPFGDPICLTINGTNSCSTFLYNDL